MRSSERFKPYFGAFKMNKHLFIISGPSGVGKNTIGESVIKILNGKVTKLPTYTTRKPREGEINGCDYFFVDKKLFEKLINNEKIIEYNYFNQNYYGTSKRLIEKALKEDKNILLIIDVNGAIKINGKFPGSTTIFIDSTLKDIKNRLIRRAQNTPEQIQERLTTAKDELKQKKFYNFTVKNVQNRPEIASKKVAKIIQDMLQ